MKTKLLLMLLAIALAAGVAQANMLTNPGFEAGVYAPKNVPDDWVIYSPTYTSGWTWLSTGGIGGGRSKHETPAARPDPANAALPHRTRLGDR